MAYVVIWMTAFALNSKKGFSKSEIANLYTFIDWLIGLPRELELEYIHEVHALEESTKMAYVTSIERYGLEVGLKVGLKKGLEQGLERGLEQAMGMAAQRLLANGADVAFIAQITDLPVEKIKALRDDQTEVV
jgi:predicted transposase/invertase (TIGR01784 family)